MINTIWGKVTPIKTNNTITRKEYTAMQKVIFLNP